MRSRAQFCGAGLRGRLQCVRTGFRGMQHFARRNAKNESRGDRQQHSCANSNPYLGCRYLRFLIR